jgi:Ca2+-binding RTX toxin-like protein
MRVGGRGGFSGIGPNGGEADVVGTSAWWDVLAGAAEFNGAFAPPPPSYSNPFGFTIVDGCIVGGQYDGYRYFECTAQASLISGSNGNDFIWAPAGGSVVHSGDGNDVIIVGGGSNLVDSGAGADVIVATGGNSLIVAGADDDTVVAEGGNNAVFGCDGADRISVGDGPNYVDAGSGTNVAYVGDGWNFVTGDETTVVGPDGVSTAPSAEALGLEAGLGSGGFEGQFPWAGPLGAYNPYVADTVWALGQVSLQIRASGASSLFGSSLERRGGQDD